MLALRCVLFRSPVGFVFFTFWVEVVLAIYFTWLVLLAMWKGQWQSLPFLAMFQFGFVFVVAGSMKHWITWPGFDGSDPEPPPSPSPDAAIA